MKADDIYLKALQDISSYVNVEEKSFLVTGASGLIGSCLIDLLMFVNRKQGKRNHVYALGRNALKLKDRFSLFVGDKYFHIIEQDVCQQINDKFAFDFIVHGASNADPIAYVKYPVETMQTTLLGAINILEYGRKHKGCKIVMLSTFEVYGKADHDVYKEKDAGIIDFNTLRASYPESKRSMEILSRSYVDEYGVLVNIARLSSIYGPTMITTDSKAHAQFIRCAVNGKDIELKSKGEQRRTYCHVIDAISGILTILTKGETGECYNIANEDAVTSIAELAQIVANIAEVNVVFEKPSALEVKGYSKPQDIILDNKKLCALGWNPLFPIYTGMKMTVDILKKENYVHT